MRQFIIGLLCMVAGFAACQSPANLPDPIVLKVPSAKAGPRTTVDLKTGTVAVYGDPNQMIQISSLSFSDDGTRLSVGYTPGDIDLWDVSTHRIVRTVSGADVAVLSHDGSLLATGEIAVIETATGKVRCRDRWVNESGNQTVSRMHFSPDGKVFAVTANGLDIGIYASSTCRKVTTLARARDGDFTPDGLSFVAANYQVMTVWSAQDWKLLQTFPAGPDYITSFAVSPAGHSALIGGPHGARLVRISDGSTIRKLGDGYVLGVSFTANGIAMVRDHSQVAFWDSDGHTICSNRNVEGPNVALAPNDNSLAAGVGHQRDVFLWPGARVDEACHLSR